MTGPSRHRRDRYHMVNIPALAGSTDEAAGFILAQFGTPTCPIRDRSVHAVERNLHPRHCRAAGTLW
jgi:hypothetical protein